MKFIYQLQEFFYNITPNISQEIRSRVKISSPLASLRPGPHLAACPKTWRRLSSLVLGQRAESPRLGRGALPPSRPFRPAAGGVRPGHLKVSSPAASGGGSLPGPGRAPAARPHSRGKPPVPPRGRSPRSSPAPARSPSLSAAPNKET